MLSRIYRQRRRIVFMTLGGMLAGSLKLGVGTGALWCGLTGMGLACVLVTLAPNRRSWIEALGIGLTLAALPPIPDGSYPLASMSFAALIYLAIHGRWSDRTTLRLGLVSHRISRVYASPIRVWTALIPGEGHPDDHWTGTLVDYDHDPDDFYTTYLRYRTPDGLHEDVTVTFLDHDAPNACRYVIERFEEGFAEAGILSIAIREAEPGLCLIDSKLSFDALPPRMALGRWLDDTFGDEWDSFAAAVSARRDWSIHGLNMRMPAGLQVP